MITVVETACRGQAHVEAAAGRSPDERRGRVRARRAHPRPFPGGGGFPCGAGEHLRH